MKRETLPLLRCIQNGANAQCAGELSLDTSALSPSYSPHDPGEIVEGLLCCQSCGAHYPILTGVAILVPQLRTYLRDNYASILQLTLSQGGISEPMQQWLIQQSAHRDRAKSAGPQRYSGATRLGVYLSAHYDRLEELIAPDHPLQQVIRAIYHQDLYTAFCNLADPFLSSNAISLDVGCNVGRLSYELASRSQLVYGVDIAFGPVLAARRLLLGYPSALTSYEMVRNGLNIEMRSLHVEHRSNVDFLVASGTDLPFAEGTFDIVGSANLIDVIPDPPGLLRSKARVLKKQGVLMITDPYWWDIDDAPLEKWIGGCDGVAPEQAIRQAFADLGLEILAENDMVPWILRYHDRQISLHFNHSLIARKR